LLVKFTTRWNSAATNMLKAADYRPTLHKLIDVAGGIHKMGGWQQ
jgi:hypothetical protein